MAACDHGGVHHPEDGRNAASLRLVPPRRLDLGQLSPAGGPLRSRAAAPSRRRHRRSSLCPEKVLESPSTGDWEETLNRRSVIAICACAALLAACHTLPEVGSRLPQIGLASWYGPHFQRKRTADGERFDMNALTAAHRTLPFGSYVRVTNLENGRSVVVRINDRGPFIGDRIIDLSARAGRDLGMRRNGVARVRIDRVTAGRARLWRRGLP